MFCGGILALSPSNIARSTDQEIRCSLSTAEGREIRKILTSELVFLESHTYLPNAHVNDH